jgi:hypothetical protein
MNFKMFGLKSSITSRRMKGMKKLLRHDHIAVSEAIGTILLLAIGITLVGVVAVWVTTLPGPTEVADVNLVGTYEDSTIIVKHNGGEVIDSRDIDILIMYKDYPYLFNLTDSENEDCTDSKLSIGETWEQGFNTNIGDELEINVISSKGTDSKKTLLQEKLIVGGGPSLFPDLAISAENIKLQFNGEGIEIDEPVTITIKVYNLGNMNASNVIIRFFDDNDIITYQGAEYKTLNISYQYKPGVKNWEATSVVWSPDRWGQHNLYIKVYSIYNELNYANNYATRQVSVASYPFRPHGPDLYITPYDVLLSNSYPIRGEDIDITVVTHNIGTRHILKGENITVHLEDTKNGGLYYNYTITEGIKAGRTHQHTFTWDNVKPGGTSYIKVAVDTDQNITDELNRVNNKAERLIQILPTILVVNDDGVDTPPDQSPLQDDSSRYIVDSLSASGVRFDVTTATSTTPSYSIGTTHLSKYDIIIWTTGYESENTLTLSNQQALQKALDNGSYLWMVGQDICVDTTNNNTPAAGHFIYDYLGVGDYEVKTTPGLLEGIYGDPITDGMLIGTSNIVSGSDRAVNMTPRYPGVGDEVEGILKNDTVLGASSNNTIRYYNATRNGRTVFFGWEFGAIANPIDRANLTYHVLKWFNYSIVLGDDFAVVSQSFSDEAPKFMEKIEIFATVRNNGPNDETVYVAFYAEGLDGEEELIPEFPDGKENPMPVYLTADGGEALLSKEWLATSVGAHDFRVMIDPYNNFDEITELNNDITYVGLNVIRLTIGYTILVVDDDNSVNNGGYLKNDNVTQNMTNALDKLGYDYDTAVVQGGLIPKDGPNVSVLKTYNAVIWLTGNDSAVTLTDIDQENISAYLEGRYEEAQYITDLNVNLLLIGQDILDDLDGPGIDLAVTNDFLTNILKIDNYTTSVGLPTTMDGLYHDPITHGIQYPIDNTTFNDKSDSFVIEDSINVSNILWQDSSHTKVIGAKVDENKYDAVFLPWEFSLITDSETGPGFDDSIQRNKIELVFLVLNWFGLPDDRIELKTSDIDIELNDMNPVIGDRYIIRTDVYNYGPQETSTVIRFLDGSTLINTQPLYVPANGNSSIEALWTPLYAGLRTLSISVDSGDYVPEVFETLNNNASLDLYIYFFHDDMEKGTKNWLHDSTITRINGESPLEFLDEPVYTDVNDTFEVMQGFEINTSTSHTYDTSFYAEEPLGFTGKAEALLAIVLDDSMSMQDRTIGGDTWLDRAKEAANILVELLHDTSYVSVWHVDKNKNDRQVINLTPIKGSGLQTVKDAINNTLSASGHTVLWDSIGEAYEDLSAEAPKHPDLEPILVVLSDGSDYGSSDSSAYQWQKMEAGSSVWSPWGSIAGGVKNYPNHQGKYRWYYDFPTNNYADLWNTVGGGSYVPNRKGLLNSDIRMYTIGLGLEHHEPPDVNKTATWPGNLVSDTNSVYTNGIESGTLEYNLWRLATTSDGQYFYAPTPEELKDIFTEIAEAIKGLKKRRRSAEEDMPLLNARVDEEEYEIKYAMTYPFSLVGVSTAKLSFYHKFDLYDAYNGAVILVGTRNPWDPPNAWNYKYVTPLQLYNSNLWLDETEYDDYGTPMVWGYNGVSSSTTLDWEYVEVDLTQFVGQQYVKINFSMFLYGGGGGGGWWLDDVEIKVSRSNQLTYTNASKDQWELTTTDAHSGDHSWWNHNALIDTFTGGIDNSLYTRSIDLTSAREATLSAYFKFNINKTNGRPSDGFRVEVSDDNGVTWKQINIGSRAAWGISGNESDIGDGLSDGKSYTGLDVYGDDTSEDSWIEASTLTRLMVNLSGWSGSVIKIRFRMVTASDGNPYFNGNHFENSTVGFGGLFIDDVTIYGDSLLAGNFGSRGGQPNATDEAKR